MMFLRLRHVASFPLVRANECRRNTAMNLRQLILALLISGLTSAVTLAQANNPLVSMSITLPDGETKEVTAPESGLATIALNDGTEIGCRPTIQDSKPWTHVVVAIFKTPTAVHPSQLLGEIEVKAGGSAVPSKTTPAFKLAVT
jgi:hypothetical protein